MPPEFQQQLLICTGILLVPFFIGMALWARKLREDSGWALLEERYPQKDKFCGSWQICRALRLQGISGFLTVDIGWDSGYLFLRPTQHGDILKRPLQIPWSAISAASKSENFVELLITGNKNVVLALDCLLLAHVVEQFKLRSIQ